VAHWLGRCIRAVVRAVETSDGLCCRLVMACPKQAQLVPFKNLEVTRNNLQLVNKLGAGQFGEVWAGMSVCLSVCLSVSLQRRRELKMLGCRKLQISDTTDHGCSEFIFCP